MTRRPGLMILAGLVLLSGLVSCGKAHTAEPVQFQNADVELMLSAPMTPGFSRPSLTRDDDAFYGPANGDEKANSLFLSVRTADDLVWLSLEVLDANARKRHLLDSEAQGRLTVLIGETCDGAMGNLLGAGCRWYSSDFYQKDCAVTLETASTQMVSGRVVCGALGANCPSGTGIRASSGTCLDGERFETISLSMRFHLSDSLKVSEFPESR